MTWFQHEKLWFQNYEYRSYTTYTVDFICIIQMDFSTFLWNHCININRYYININLTVSV